MPSFRKGPNRLLKVQSGAQDLARRGRLVQRAHEERDGRVQAALPSPPFPLRVTLPYHSAPERGMSGFTPPPPPCSLYAFPYRTSPPERGRARDRRSGSCAPRSTVFVRSSKTSARRCAPCCSDS